LIYRVPSTVCHFVAECMIAKSSVYANFLEVVVGKSLVYILNKSGAKTYYYGTRYSDGVTCFVDHYWS